MQYSLQRDLFQAARSELPPFSACLLDAIPSHIAILDQLGEILYVNQHWKQFAQQNNWKDPSFGIGTNYFDAISNAISDRHDDPSEVAQGIRDVIYGIREVYQHEYPCDTPDQRLWFLMKATRFELEGSVRLLVSHENITDRKTAELLVQGKEQLLRSVYDSSSDAIVLLADNAVFDCNAKAIQLFGFTSLDEFQRVHPADLSPPVQPDGIESRVKAAHHTQQAMDNGETRFNWIHRRKDGNLFSAEVLLTCFESQGRQLMQATVRDITYRKEVEEALRRGREDLNIAQRIAHVGSWYWDLEADHLTWSDQLYEMYGCDPKWPPLRFYEQQSLFTLDSYNCMNIAIDGTMETGVPFELELEMISETESPKWIWFRGEVVKDSCGSRVGMRGIAQDITERKKAEEAREEALGRLEKIASRLPGVVYQFRLRNDGTCSFPYASERMLEIHGVSPEEVRDDGSRAFEFHHPDDTVALMNSLIKSVEDLSPWKQEFRLKFPDERVRWIAGNSIPEREADGGTLFHGYFEDVTERVQAQQNLIAAHAAAKSANRAKSEFLANMSHEIRTPMTAILGYADILAEGQRNGLPQEMQVDCIDTIKRNGEHLLSIINDILDISKIEADKLVAESISASPLVIVAEVLELMKVKAEAKGIAVKLAIESSIPATIQTDPTRLRQILVNLVGNAIKFTELGSVTVSLHMNTACPSQICFDVIDTGIGLDEENLRRLFQPFEQADASTTRRFGGTGLGLQISKRLAQILGGDITVTSTRGEGSVFSASVSTGCLQKVTWVGKETSTEPIPAAESIGLKDSEIEAPQNQQLLQGMRILLAEDGPDNQRLISFHLAKAGATVELVENGRLAIERLCVDGTLQGALLSPPPFDVVLMDMQMPEMDGYDATMLLRSKGFQSPVLALTAHAMDIDLDKCLTAGCNVRITKPIEKSELINACLKWGKSIG